MPSSGPSNGIREGNDGIPHPAGIGKHVGNRIHDDAREYFRKSPDNGFRQCRDGIRQSGQHDGAAKGFRDFGRERLHRLPYGKDGGKDFPHCRGNVTDNGRHLPYGRVHVVDRLEGVLSLLDDFLLVLFLLLEHVPQLLAQ